MMENQTGKGGDNTFPLCRLISICINNALQGLPMSAAALATPAEFVAFGDPVLSKRIHSGAESTS